ncbi:MAG: hypothetical protein LBF41_06635 [Deltaproteobacteria bacterium]|nr:hypothetical protein [Deltaproteobacteria bacterium]
MIEFVIVCHEELAQYLVKVMEFLIKEKLNCQTVAIREGEHPDEHGKKVETALKAAAGRDDHPVLVFTDLFGGTACNVSLAHLRKDRVEVLSGVNLAMLMRAWQWRRRHPETTLGELANECARFAMEGIRVCSTGMPMVHPKDAAQKAKSEKDKTKKEKKNARENR